MLVSRDKQQLKLISHFSVSKQMSCHKQGHLASREAVIEYLDHTYLKSENIHLREHSEGQCQCLLTRAVAWLSSPNALTFLPTMNSTAEVEMVLVLLSFFYRALLKTERLTVGWLFS
jgi:hypothetical protein